MVYDTDLFIDTIVVFAPVSDLKSLSQAGLEGREIDMNKKDATIVGGHILGDEWAEHVVKNRTGIILRPRFDLYATPFS